MPNNTKMHEEYFSASYEQARNRFRAATANAPFKYSAPIPGYTGAQGEDLTIDIAVYGDTKNPVRVFLHSSGVHGVEGYAGSAIQLHVISTFDFASVKPGDAVVFVHVVNPFGMSWGRRWNEHNVDLNRNMFYPVAGQDPYAARGTSGMYKALSNVLNPAKLPSCDKLRFMGTAANSIRKHGMPALKQATVEGQNAVPNGLFFGGSALETSHRLLFAFLDQWIGDVAQSQLREVFVLDVHTGLGPYGRDTLLMKADASTQEAWTKAYPNSVFQGWTTVGRGSIAYDMEGGTVSGYRSYFQAKFGGCVHVSGFTQEFGTYGPVKVLYNLRKENALWHQPAGSTDADRVCAFDIFNPTCSRWRNQILSRGWEVFQRTVAHVFRYTDMPIRGGLTPAASVWVTIEPPVPNSEPRARTAQASNVDDVIVTVPQGRPSIAWSEESTSNAGPPANAPQTARTDGTASTSARNRKFHIMPMIAELFAHEHMLFTFPPPAATFGFTK